MRIRAARSPKPPFYPPEQMTFSVWLKAALEESRLTGAELAERADLSKAAIYFYLDGSRIPGSDAVQKICAALHLDPSTVPSITRRQVGRPAHKHNETERR